MTSEFDRTTPMPSRWDQEDAEFVGTDSEWCMRFAAQLVALDSGLSDEKAMQLAYELSSNGYQRARRPELVADEMTRGDWNVAF